MNPSYASHISGETRPGNVIDYNITIHREPTLREARERCTQAALALAVAYDALLAAEREKSAADAAYMHLLKM